MAKEIVIAVIASIATAAILWLVSAIGRFPGMISVPSGAVVAFDAKRCPNQGWEEYEHAYGRFIRGIDKSGKGIDPEGERVVGHFQEDASKKHAHTAKMEIGAEPLDGRAQAPQAAGAHGRHGTYYTSNGLVVPYGAEESRPKNVALLYCKRL